MNRVASQRRSVLCAAVVAACLVAGSAVPANANSIGLFDTVFNTDYTTASLGLRDVGAGNLLLNGVTGPVTKAYLFWQGPTNSGDPAANANVTFAGTPVTGTNIGMSSDNFWGMANGQAYRADVTSLVTGDGGYALSNFQKLPTVAINGVSLVVFFDDGNPTNNRDFVMFNGNDSNFQNPFDNAGWDLTLNGINYSAGTANLVTYVSDGQNFGPFDDGTLRVNGTPIATGGIFQGLSPRAPGAGVSNGSLTDVRTFDITGLLVPGPNTLHVTLDAGFNDALSLILAGIDLPAGAAPTQSEVPEPGTVFLVGCGAALLRRRASKRA